jgi:hypothetical protein
MKTNRLNFTFLLLVVLVVLGGVTWWLLSTQEGAVNKKLVLSLPSQNITGLEITKTGPDGQVKQLTLRLDGKDSWKLTSPVAEPADANLVKTMLEVFNKFQSEETITDAGSLSEYGLDQPVLKVKVIMSKPYVLLIGAQTPVQDQFYAKFEGKPEILIIDSLTKNSLSQELSNLRLKKIFTFDTNSVDGLKIESKNLRCQVKKVDGQWNLSEPFADKLVAGKVEGILSSLQSLNANDFIDNPQDAVKYGLDKPEYSLELNLGKDKVLSVKANKVEKDYYLVTSDRPAIFKINGEQALSFLQFNLGEQIEKKLVNDDLSQIESVEFQEGHNPKQLFKDNQLKDLWNSSLNSLSMSQPYFLKDADPKPVASGEFQNRQPLYQYTLNLFTKKSNPLVLKVYPAMQKNSIYLITSSERNLVYEINNSLIDGLNNKVKEIINGPPVQNKTPEPGKGNVIDDLKNKQ